MANRTGRAIGSLDPVIYFENEAGHILLAPQEIGHGLEVARRLYGERYRHQGFQWREAGTWPEVTKLQQRLIDQETAVLKAQGEKMDQARERARKSTASNMRQRMASKDCDPWERDFLAAWLDLRESKRDEYVKRFTERNLYLFAVEMDGKTRVEDRMGDG